MRASPSCCATLYLSLQSDVHAVRQSFADGVNMHVLHQIYDKPGKRGPSLVGAEMHHSETVKALEV